MTAKRLTKIKGMIFFLIISMAGMVSAQDIPPSAIELSLEDVTELALKNSLDIQIIKFDTYMERTSLQRAEAIFDALLNAEISYEHDKRMQATSLIGSDEKKRSFSLGIEKKLPSGTTLTLDTTTEKVSTNNAYVTLNPYNEAKAEISITQSLGKNFFGIADRSDIKITKIDIENSDLTSLDDIEKTLYAIQESYWNLVLKDTELSIAEDMLKKAERLYEIYKDKYPLGLVEESELLAMEALLNTRKGDVFIAQLQRETAKNDLLFLINRGDFPQDIKPKDTLICSTDIIYLYKALQEAIQNRRDYKRIKNELKRNKIDIVVKKNALWPEIDLEASFVRNNIDSRSTSAWTDIGKNSNDDISIGIKFKVPLENREAKAELKKASLEKEKLLLKLKRIERLILQELNNKVNQVNTMQNQVELFEFTVKLHERKLDEQIKRLNYGRSDSDTLIRYEEDLLKARLSLASYFYRYRIGLVELKLAQNSLLDEYWKEPL